MKSKKLLIVVGFLLGLFGLGVGKIEAAFSVNADVGVYQETTTTDNGRCYGPCYSPDQEIIVEVSNLSVNGEPIADSEFDSIDVRVNVEGSLKACSFQVGDSGSGNCSMTVGAKPTDTSKDEIKLNITAGTGNSSGDRDSIKKNITLDFYTSCENFTCNEEPGSSMYKLCAQIPPDQGEAIDRCYQCFDDGGIWTAVGCINREPSSVISTVIKLGLVIAGAVVLIIILVASFMLSTSQGDPNKTKEAKDLITSAVIGLLFIIFSITILQFIGVSILHIPGFGE